MLARHWASVRLPGFHAALCSLTTISVAWANVGTSLAVRGSLPWATVRRLASAAARASANAITGYLPSPRCTCLPPTTSRWLQVFDQRPVVVVFTSRLSP